MRIIMCVRQLKLLTSLNIKRRHGIWIKHRNRNDYFLLKENNGVALLPNIIRRLTEATYFLNKTYLHAII